MNLHKILSGNIVVTLILLSIPAHSQWLRTTTGLPSHCSGGFAIDARGDSVAAVVIATGGSVNVYRTSNCGGTWDSVSSGFGTICVTIVDNSHLWMGTLDGKIIATSNGGQTWAQQFLDPLTSGEINFIRMFDLNVGVAMADGLSPQGPAVFLRTTDGGSTWKSMNDSAFGGYTSDFWRQVSFVDADLGYFWSAYASSPKIFKTTTGGSHWMPLTHSPGQATAMRFFDAKIGITLTWNGGINRTTDGGLSWESFVIPQGGWGEDVEFAPGDPAKVWTTDKARVYFSSDTGRTWITQLTAPGSDIALTSDKRGWVLDDSGGVWQTSNGGASFVDRSDNHLPQIFYLEQNYPNPFNPSTRIQYVLSQRQHVKLTVFTSLGQELATLVDEFQGAGIHVIDFTGKQNGRGFSMPASGVYLYSLSAGSSIQTRKMILLR